VAVFVNAGLKRVNFPPALTNGIGVSSSAGGRAMTLEQAIEYALKIETRPEEGHSNVAHK
jgi:hypothetical protein